MHGCSALSVRCRPTCRPLNDPRQTNQSRGISAGQAEEQFPVGRPTLSASTAAVRYRALSLPRLEIDACANCDSEGRALLPKTIGIPRSRPTIDIDMLRRGQADQGSLIALVKDCATLDVEPDGLTFLADSVVAEEITEGLGVQGNTDPAGRSHKQRTSENSNRFRRRRCRHPRPETDRIPHLPGWRHHSIAGLSCRNRARRKASSHGGTGRAQQSNEGLLRRLDLLEVSRL